MSKKHEIELTEEYLTDRYVNKRWSFSRIYQETGWSASMIGKAVKRFNLQRRRNLRGLDLVGQKFGELEVVNADVARKKSNFWYCKCSCGNEVSVSTGNLLSQNTSSCGCKHYPKGSENKCWKGQGEISGRYWHILNQNAKKRGIYFDLTIEHIWTLFENQGGRCALTGWPITIAKDSSQTASLDRINSSKGYVSGNIQWVHKDINKAKNVFSQEYFIELCKAVASK